MELFRLLGRIALEGAEEAQQDLEETTGKAESSEPRFTSAFKKIGGALVTYLSAQKIIEFGQAIVSASAEVSAEASAFEQIMGDYAETARDKMEAVANATGVVDTRLTGYMTSLTAKFKGLGYEVDTATSLAADGLMLASDASAFWDKSLDDAMSHLNSFINGSYEGGEAIGLFANETQLAQYAIQSGLVASKKDWQALDEATKQATRLEYAKQMYALSGATGQMAKESGQYLNTQGNLNEKWRQFKALIGEPLLQNVVTPAMTMLGNSLAYVTDKLKDASSIGEGFKNLFSELVRNVNEKIPEFVANASTMMANFGAKIKENMPVVISKALDMLTQFSYTIVQNAPKLVASGMELIVNLAKGLIDSLPTLIQKVPQIVTNIANTITKSMQIILLKGAEIIWELIKGILGAIPDLIANFPKVIEAIFAVWQAVNWVNLGKNIITGIGNGIKNMANSLKTDAAGVFNNVKNAMMHPIETAKTLIKGIIDKIKGFFNFKATLPKIALPHFSITPKGWSIGDLLKGKIPSLGIEWYAKAMDKGMILDKPTIFGYSSGNLLGAGEAGSETVVGTESLLSMIKQAVGGSNIELARIMSNIYELLSDEDRMHRIIVRALTDGSFKVELDNREVGRIVRAYAR